MVLLLVLVYDILLTRIYTTPSNHCVSNLLAVVHFSSSNKAAAIFCVEQRAPPFLHQIVPFVAIMTTIMIYCHLLLHQYF